MSAASANQAEVIARLSAMQPIDYDRVRKEEAKALGIQVKTLDELVKAARTGDRAGGRMPFAEHEPADDPVDPARLFDDIVAVIKRHIILNPEQADAAALWVAHTHLTEVADVSPLAIINAPERACAYVFTGYPLPRTRSDRGKPAASLELSIASS
jgi:hypothetical protein